MFPSAILCLLGRWVILFICLALLGTLLFYVCVVFVLCCTWNCFGVQFFVCLVKTSLILFPIWIHCVCLVLYLCVCSSSWRREEDKGAGIQGKQTGTVSILLCFDSFQCDAPNGICGKVRICPLTKSRLFPQITFDGCSQRHELELEFCSQTWVLLLRIVSLNMFVGIGEPDFVISRGF